MILYILRGAFLLLAAAVASLYLLGSQEGVGVTFGQWTIILLLALAVAGVVVAADILNPHKRLSAVSGVFLGLIAGLIAAYALSFVVDLFGVLTAPEITAAPPDITPASARYAQLPPAQQQGIDRLWENYRLQLQDQTERREAYLNLLEGVKVFIGLITCYISISLVFQTKDDFRFVIPYVEFAKEIRGNRPTVLDTSVIVDGRILDIISTRILQGVVIVPKFVLNELQTIADAGDKIKRARGRRGLDVLQKLQDSHLVEVVADDRDVEGANVDQKLVNLARERQGRLMTNDYNLNKVATLRGVDVVNLNDLAKAMRPVVLPGEQMTVRPVKPGESPQQGVAYLDDGTMVVVEDGREFIGQEVEIVVTSTFQTSAGRMIFGRYDRGGGSMGSGLSGSRAALQPPTEHGPDRPPADEPGVEGASDQSGPRRPPRTPSRRNPRRG